MQTQWQEMPPREKLLDRGACALTDTELLAIFLRTGSKGVHVMALAEQLINEFGSLYGLMTAEKKAFNRIDGIGMAKFAQLNAIVELARRFFSCREALSQSAIASPADMINYLYSVLAHREREIFLVIYFDNQHRVIEASEMFAGSLSSVEVHPREIVRQGLKRNAAALALAHNHPSGLAEPSQADRDITQQIICACQLLNIRVLDHIVIGRGQYVSFAERGWL